jgi:radical SAM protein with 4Fe4S-binding SPASM domain
MESYKTLVRNHNNIDINLFNKIMVEIDIQGKRQIALHKDGEPLLHPNIIEILARVKRNNQHTVYLTTNGHLLKADIIHSILENKIDVINFSIGAESEEFYSKVRGRGFKKVISNIKSFLTSIEKSIWKPKVIVQIIDLKEYEEMNEEIIAFKKFWDNYDVEIEVWKKLTWGTFENIKFSYRYPCYSLWNSFNINSNGIVTACCMDWKQDLIIGNSEDKTIEEIWKDNLLNNLREKHVLGEEESIEMCINCNYWQWQPMLLDYPLKCV